MLKGIRAILNALGGVLSNIARAINLGNKPKTMEEMKQRTEEGYQTVLRNSMEHLQAAGGDIRVVEDEVNQLAAYAKQLERERNQYIRAHPDRDNVVVQRGIAQRQRSIQGVQEHLVQLRADIEATKAEQEAAANMVGEKRTEQLVTSTNMTLYISQDRINELQKSLLRHQSASVTGLEEAGEDYSDEMRQRVARGRGEVEGVQRFNRAVLGAAEAQASQPLDDEEMAFLQSAYEQANVQPPTQQTDNKSDQTAS